MFNNAGQSDTQFHKVHGSGRDGEIEGMVSCEIQHKGHLEPSSSKCRTLVNSTLRTSHNLESEDYRPYAITEDDCVVG